MKNLIKSDTLELSGKKLKMAEMLANPEYNGTNKQIYEELGISHDTFYRWINDEKILKHAARLISRYTDSELAYVWKALIKKCKEGDVQAIRLYFSLKGKLWAPDEKSGTLELLIKGLIQPVQIVDDLPKE